MRRALSRAAFGPPSVELLYTSLFLGRNQFVYVGSWIIIITILILGAAQVWPDKGGKKGGGGEDGKRVGGDGKEGSVRGAMRAGRGHGKKGDAGGKRGHEEGRCGREEGT